MKKWYKKCPYCTEEIKKEAIKCRYCWEFILKNNVTQENAKLNNKFWKDTISCKKRFWKYILYLFRDWGIYAILRAISISQNNIYDYGCWPVDIFICFLTFIFETVYLIVDCVKIKKWICWTYEKQEENWKKYKCNGCWQIVSQWDKKCVWCWKNLSRLEIEKKEGVKILKRLLCFIPNAFVLFTFSCVFLWFIWGLFPLLDPYFYREPMSYDCVSAFLVISIVVPLFIALFVPTKKALYSLSWKRILLCLIWTIVVYIYYNDKLQHQIQLQERYEWQKKKPSV